MSQCLHDIRQLKLSHMCTHVLIITRHLTSCTRITLRLFYQWSSTRVDLCSMFYRIYEKQCDYNVNVL